MKYLFIACLVIMGLSSRAQVTKVSLQASGLTCSMCSKAVKTALEKVSFVEKVQVDIKNQEYHLSFRESAEVDLDALGLAVEDAGFSVAKLTVTATLPQTRLGKDEHIQIGKSYFHFLNATGNTLDGAATFTVVDARFVPAKAFKKYIGMSKMACVKTGRQAGCCTTSDIPPQARIYHAII